MKTVEVRGVTIGEGLPKICVSVMGITREHIMERAKELRGRRIDIIEWRADWYCHVQNEEKMLDVLEQLRELLGDRPLLFTIRTANEGGEIALHIKEYVELCKTAIRSRWIDLIDVELYTGDHQVLEIIEEAHKNGVRVVVSNHDFQRTPSKEEMVRRMCKMQELGADIAKLAVMPQSKKDVLMLLEATEEMKSNHSCGPLITISMGREGVISRVCGEIFGSDATFGAVGKMSAPGQIDADKLRNILECLQEAEK